MFRLSTMPAGGGKAVPRRVTTLSVSWLNGQFKAVAIRRGVVEGSWEHPGEAGEVGEFEELIREAVEQTNYCGQTVSLVLAHPRLVQQLVDVSPVKGRALHRVLQQQAQQQGLFSDQAAWAYQVLLPANGTQRVVLHLFPRPLLDQLVHGCRANGLELISAVPASAVVHHQLAQLSLEEDEVTLLAAETGGSTTVVAGRGDGRLLLARTLPNTWNSSMGGLAMDLNRTILSLTQQYDVELNDAMWVFGPDAREQAPALEEEMQLPVAVIPDEYRPFYWATEALKLRPRRTPNLLSGEFGRRPRMRAYARAVGVSAALLILAAATAAFSGWQARQETVKLERLRQRAAQLHVRRQLLQQRNARLTEDQQSANLALAGRPEPVPLWFLGYLSDALPPELAATYLHLLSETNGWTVQIATTWGAGRPEEGAMPPEVSDALARLRAQLCNGPFHLQPLSASVAEASARPDAGPQVAADPLFIEGVIQ